MTITIERGRLRTGTSLHLTQAGEYAAGGIATTTPARFADYLEQFADSYARVRGRVVPADQPVDQHYIRTWTGVDPAA